MKESNLKILGRYRMYQAPEGGAEKPVRTSYLKDPLDVSTPRGVGGAGAEPQCQGQILSENCQGHFLSTSRQGHFLSEKCQGQKLSDLCQGQNVSSLQKVNSKTVVRWMVSLELPSSCPVVNLFDTTSQHPSHGWSMTQPTSKTAHTSFQRERSVSTVRDG